jgi:cation transporter-like permease
MKDKLKKPIPVEDEGMRKLTPRTTEVIYLEIEKSRINREKSKLVLDKSFVLYFSFLVVGVLGFAFNFITSVVLNVLVICGIVILVIGTFPYVFIIHKEEKKIDGLLKELK